VERVQGCVSLPSKSFASGQRPAARNSSSIARSTSSGSTSTALSRSGFATPITSAGYSVKAIRQIRSLRQPGDRALAAERRKSRACVARRGG